MMKILSISIFLILFFINYLSCRLSEKLDSQLKELNAASEELGPQIQQAIKDKFLKEELKYQESSYQQGKELARQLANNDTLIHFLDSREMIEMNENPETYHSLSKLAEQKRIVIKIGETLDPSNVSGFNDLMDSVIDSRFGKDYMSRLKKDAAIYCFDTLETYYCDNYEQSFYTTNFYFTTDDFVNGDKDVDNLYGKLISQQCPVLNITFYIDHHGNLSNMTRDEFLGKPDYYKQLTDEEEDHLWRLAREELKKYKKWKPCKVGGQIAITKFTATIYFDVNLLDN